MSYSYAMFKNRSNGKIIAAPGPTPTWPLFVEAPKSGDMNQFWRITREGFLQSMSKYIGEVYKSRKEPGTSVVLGTRNSPPSAYQLWTYDSDGTIRSQLTDACLDIGDKNSLVIKSRNGSISQLWDVVSDKGKALAAGCSGDGGYCYCLVTNQSGLRSFGMNVKEGAPNLSFYLTSNGKKKLSSKVGFEMVAPDGKIFDINTKPTDQVLPVAGAKGLIGFYYEAPQPGLWTARMQEADGDWAMVCTCCPSVDPPRTIEQAAQTLTPKEVSLIEAVENVGSDGATRLRSAVPGSCLVCHLQWGVIAVLALALGPSGLLVVSAGSRICRYAADLYGVSESAAVDALRFLGTISDPLEWPGAFCKWFKMCE